MTIAPNSSGTRIGDQVSNPVCHPFPQSSQDISLRQAATELDSVAFAEFLLNLSAEEIRGVLQSSWEACDLARRFLTGDADVESEDVLASVENAVRHHFFA